MTEPMIRVYLVEDHTIVRAGLVALMETASDLEVVGESADGRTALGEIETLSPDVVLCDLAPDYSGVPLAEEVLKLGRRRQIGIQAIFALEDQQHLVLALPEIHRRLSHAVLWRAHDQRYQ